MNESRWKTQDYFDGEIKRGGQTVAKINGNYMGYFDIDGVRYWDIRDKDMFFTPAEMRPTNLPGVIPSDSTLRNDSIAMLNRPIEEAQVAKEDMEKLQRHDRKLREEAAKRRANKGPKFVYPQK